MKVSIHDHNEESRTIVIITGDDNDTPESVARAYGTVNKILKDGGNNG